MMTCQPTIRISIVTLLMFTTIAKAKEPVHCYGYLTEMVRSSNFPVREVTKDKINLLIDEDQPSMITAQVIYDVTRQPDNSSFTSIGWIKYDVANHILWNNSANLDEHPVKLSFNPQYADGFDRCRK
ncbi:unnamed protein product [Commensalibacter communis]|uniref:hypothetical protein n=1 Tax=Commensalibacter communis TaxID=2972786 RepID=UPI0022FF916B|nr:hypothetical protein [Commensalibacter communis]CAI3953822.1 unnamed protein product [Commensalibacter communis]